MPSVDSRASLFGQSRPDVLVVGAGIMGLWAAFMAARAGLSVVVADRDHIGAGASGGLLGALMPHLPDRWNDKKQFQLQALVSLEDEIAALEAQTGYSAGYRRSGRLIPLAAAHHRDRALRHSADAATAWTCEGRSFSFDVLDTPPLSGWPDAAIAETGVAFDHLAGRVSPRKLLALLGKALDDAPRVRVLTGADVVTIDPLARVAHTGDGDEIAFGHVIISAGVGSFKFLHDLVPVEGKPVGVAVKGQAALFKADIDPSLPILFDSGTYVVPHEAGYCAVGSTSEESFDDAASTDALLDGVVERAFALAPVLRRATLIERWAGLRPKAIGRDPMAGAHPDFGAVSLLTGGFKISFGVAHELARAVVMQINGGSLGLPPSFKVAAHLEAARRR